MENQAKTNTEQKEQQLKKLSKMSLIRSLLPVVGLVVIFLTVQCTDEFQNGWKSCHWYFPRYM